MKKSMIYCLLICILTGCVAQPKAAYRNTRSKGKPVLTPISDRFEHVGVSLTQLVTTAEERQTVLLYEALKTHQYESISAVLVFNNRRIKAETDGTEWLKEFFEQLETVNFRRIEPIRRYNQRTSEDDSVRIEFFTQDMEDASFNFTLILSEDYPVLTFSDSEGNYTIAYMPDAALKAIELLGFEDTLIFAEKTEAKTYLKELVTAEETMQLYDADSFVFEEIGTETLIRRGYRDYYDTKTITPMERALTAFYYTDAFTETQRPMSEAIMTYLFHVYPSKATLNGTYDLVDEIVIDGEQKEMTIPLPEPIMGYINVMKGDEFRAVYTELFDRQSPWNESRSWIETENGATYGYLKDADLYFYSRYEDGASAGYYGWNLMELNRHQNGEILTMDMLLFYSATTRIEDSSTSQMMKFYSQLYSYNWLPIAHEDMDYKQGMAWDELMSTHTNLFSKWQLKLRVREDGSVALLSARCLNPVDDTTRFIKLDEMTTLYKLKENTDQPLFQFNLSGKQAMQINETLLNAANDENFIGYFIEESSTSIRVQVVNRHELSKERSAFLIPYEVEFMKSTLTFEEVNR